MIINEYLPGDEKFCFIQFRNFKKETFYFLYGLKMLKKNSEGKNDLFKYIKFDNILNDVKVIFLMFENIKNYEKRKKNPNRKGQIKKVYKLKNGKIQVNIELNSKNYNEIEYFNGSNKIGLLKAKQLNLT